VYNTPVLMLSLHDVFIVTCMHVNLHACTLTAAPNEDISHNSLQFSTQL